MVLISAVIELRSVWAAADLTRHRTEWKRAGTRTGCSSRWHRRAKTRSGSGRPCPEYDWAESEAVCASVSAAVICWVRVSVVECYRLGIGLVDIARPQCLVHALFSRKIGHYLPAVSRGLLRRVGGRLDLVGNLSL